MVFYLCLLSVPRTFVHYCRQTPSNHNSLVFLKLFLMSLYKVRALQPFNAFHYFVFCHSDKDKDILEVEAALYYAPNLQQVVLSMFSLENYVAFLKIKGLDPVALLQVTKIITNKAYLRKEEVSILDLLF